MSSVTTKAVCGKRVYSGSFQGRACGRPVKDDGLCAQHLAGKVRSKAISEANSKERESAWQKMLAWERVLGFRPYLYGGLVQFSEADMDRIVALLQTPPVVRKATQDGER